jgi:uncharacterized membrane protein
MTDAGAPGESDELRTFSAERAKAFIDAVVAIAMTLLILPLMESVGESAGREEGAWQWISDHDSQLISFVLSFVIIAMFWMNHHRLFAIVEQVTTGLLWIMMAWLLSIVWLPVATAMSGQMHSDDTLVKALYIGSMIVTSLLSIITRAYLLAHPTLHAGSALALKRGMSADVSMAFLFAVALVIAMLFPALGYYPMFVMALVGPIQPLAARMLGAPNPPKSPRHARS